jgi:hypothetical protein
MINPIMKCKIVITRFMTIVSLFVLSYSCEKPPEPEPESNEVVMPPLTHTGENTFGCYIDGELFVANEGESIWDISPVSGSFNEETNSLVLQGTRNNSDDLSDYMVLLVADITGPANHTLDINYDHVKGYTQKSGESFIYYHDMGNKGNCTITYFDKTQNIISGTFSMTLINNDYPVRKSIDITEGRFDFQY